ncbi:MAG: hypothetical protein H6774_03945 [Pseudomonadales bacterium]|nr:hypothetical protein [Pseudomonadales bacterium]
MSKGNIFNFDQGGIPERQTRISIVDAAFQILKKVDDSQVFEAYDPSTSLYFRGVNLGSLLLDIAEGSYLLNRDARTMHVETDPQLARPYALTDSGMASIGRKETLIIKLQKLGITTTTLGPGIVLGLSEERYLSPSEGDHGVTIKSLYSFTSY